MPWWHEYYQKNKLLLTKLYAYKMKILRLNSLTTRLAMVVMILMSVCNQASAQESYAVFKDGTLTFKHDAEKPADAYALNSGYTEPQWVTSHVNDITKVTFDASFATARPTSCAKWFNKCVNLETITGIENLNTEKVTNMNSMFTDCKKLSALDVSHFNTKLVKDMSGLFTRCHLLTTLDVSKFDTQNATNMYNMFNECKNLTILDLSNFDTQKVTSMGNMFVNCYKLTTIYASDKFVTTALLDGKDKDMFKNCAKLKGTIEFDSNETGKKHANLEGYFTSKVAEESYAVFKDGTLTFKHDGAKPADAYALNTGENAPAWATDYKDQIKTVVFEASFANARPTSCCSWFKNQKLLTKIEGIENLNTENVKTMSSMFTSCFTLKTVDVSHFNTQNLTSMYNMFASCTSLTTIDLSNFDTKEVTTMTQLFINCKNLTTIYASDKFVTTKLAAGKDKDMFKGCAKLKGTIEFDLNEIGKKHANLEGYFTAPTPTGIDQIVAPISAKAEYYDLQGRRLSQPQKGINIVKRGNKTQKILVK